MINDKLDFSGLGIGIKVTLKEFLDINKVSKVTTGYIDLSNNEISYIQDIDIWFSLISQLNLSNNRLFDHSFSDLDELLFLPKLIYLDLSNNFLESIPCVNSPSLKELILNDNNIRFFENLKNFNNLDNFSIEDNGRTLDEEDIIDIKLLGFELNDERSKLVFTKKTS